MKNFALILFLAMVFLLQCNQNPPKDLKKKCCMECQEAWSQSPAAIGPEGAKCGEFMSAKSLSEECIQYFKEHPATVSECK